MSYQEAIVLACVLFFCIFFWGAMVSERFDSHRMAAAVCLYTVIAFWFIMLVSATVFLGIFGSAFSGELPVWAGDLLRPEGPLEGAGGHYRKNIHWYFLVATLFLYWYLYFPFSKENKEPGRPNFF